MAGAPPCLEGQVCDEGEDRCVTECAVARDADGDGADAMECGGDDCDDADPGRFPGNMEYCDLDGVDEDCDPSTIGERDVDGDGEIDDRCCNGDECGTDCSDVRRSISSTGTEVCDGYDNDCDGAVDEGVAVMGFADLDGDLHGDTEAPVSACAGTAGLSAVADDCDDTTPLRHAAQLEVPDGVDNDCDDIVDEGAGTTRWFRDADMDGWGDPGSFLDAPARPAGHTALSGDCDDSDGDVFPGAPERCNGIDDDCNGLADALIEAGDFEDDDLDGAADMRCGGDDCDDQDPTAHPGAVEGRDGRDNDCDDAIDEACDSRDWFVDADGDGFGNSGLPTMSACERPAGHTARGGDCADDDPNRSPAEVEACGGDDEDCDGLVDERGAGCFLDHALAACTDGACAVRLCERHFEDCNDDPSDGCEAAVRTDELNCGACGNLCFDASDGSGVAQCSPTGDARIAACGYMCRDGFADCNGVLDGCEVDLFTDADNCGTCGMVCSDRTNASGICRESGGTGACGVACDTGFLDCDLDVSTGCEIDGDSDEMHCGVCGRVCAASDVCVEGNCLMNPFPTMGATEEFVAPAGVTVLPAGIHRYRSFTVPAGSTIRTNGNSVLEVYAEVIRIDGVIDLSGEHGGAGSQTTSSGMYSTGGEGGDTGYGVGTALSGVAASGSCAGLVDAALGGDGPGGGMGSSGCGLGGTSGGGHAGSPQNGAGGGGGFGGGGGGGGSSGPGGNGGGASGGAAGPAGDTPTNVPGGGGGGGIGSGNYAGETGQTPGAGDAGNGGGGGGGSIGLDAEADLGAATTFRAGSAGGGGAGSNFSSNWAGGGGGGGAGGALRLAASESLTLSASARLTVRGGDGGNGHGVTTNLASRSGAGGGGSGGLVYLAAPAVSMLGLIDASGGQGGVVPGRSSAVGGDGGLGRIRISTLESSCTISAGGLTPPAVSGCTPASAPERTHVGTYPP